MLETLFRTVRGLDAASNAAVQSLPADPTATTSTTLVMAGLNGAITPTRTGRLLITLSGDMQNSTSGDGVKVQLAVGSGLAPVNGAALTGTAVGSTPTFLAAAAAQRVPFSVTGLVTVPVGAGCWVDVSVAAVTGGTAALKNLCLTVVEL